jgi:nicotinamide-nucleotide amidase
MKRPEQALAGLLKKKELTIAFAESMTCGLAAHKLGTVPDTSEILMGSIVCYCEDVKCGILKIKKQLIKKHTAESQVVTDQLARNLKRLIKADIHAAITGLASPGGTETKAKPVGTVFISFIFKKKLHRHKKRFYGSPNTIKEKACKAMFSFIAKELAR